MKKYWGISLILSLPIFLFYACHFVGVFLDDQVIATGFIQLDQASYMANAKEYAERGGAVSILPLAF